jgi:hypothetical protein
VVGTNDGVALPMTHLQELVNVRWAFSQRPAVGDLSPVVSTIDVALSLLLLATQVLPQGADMRLVCLNMLVQRFMAHWQLAGDLLGATLKPQKLASLLSHPGHKCVGITARFRAFAGEFRGLFGPVASTPSISTQMATNRGLISSKQSGNLRDVVLSFHKTVNLITLNLAEVFVIHQATSTCRSGSLEC